MTGILLNGEVVEIGRLEDESGADGIVIRRADQSLVTIKGLTMDEMRGLAQFFLDPVQVVIAEPKSAALMAAAPDMLKELQEAYTVICNEVADGEDTPLAISIRELVAKVIA